MIGRGTIRLVLAVVFVGGAVVRGAVVEVASSRELAAAAARATPGTVIRLKGGSFEPGVHLRELHGTQAEPIVIEGSEATPTVFSGGTGGIQLSSCTFVVVRRITFEKQTGNAINIDDGGATDGSLPSHHVTLDHLSIRDVGSTGIVNGIKMAGVDQVTITHCYIRGWGGSAIDLVGCHEGVIEHCTITGKEGYSQNTGVQIKGGSRDITVRNNTFSDAGQRAVNAGGNTGTAYFRPPDAPYEARDVTIERNVIVGSETPVAFPGVDGAVLRYNTVVRPTKWLWRILQESTDPRFIPSRNVTIEHNVFVWEGGAENTAVNVGAHTAAETYKVRENLFFREDAPKRSKISLPGKSEGNVFGTDPRLDEKHRVTDRELARQYGQDADAE
jgi:hypothetical protein